MFTRNKTHPLDGEIERAIAHLKTLNVGSEDYTKALRAISRLKDIKAESQPEPMNRNTVATVGANLLGILMIIRHEHVNVVMSKAVGLLIKPRL